MPPTAPPEFLRYSPADIVKMGRERGTAPEQIAQAVTKHRDNIAAYGQQMHGQRFNEALPRLQQETNTALEELKPGFGVGDTLSGIGSMLGGLTTTVPAAYYGVTEGFTRPDQYSPEARAAFDANTAYQQRMQQESQQRLERGEASSTGDAFRSAGPSLGGTVGSMAAAIPASIAGAKGGALLGGAIGSAVPGPGTAVGATVGGVFGGGAAAMAAAGGVAYRMAGQQFLNDAFTALQKQRGGQMSEAEMQQAYNELLPLAENSALWEAGPEAIGNAVSLGTAKIVFGLGKPLLTNLAKTALGKAGVKVGAIAGSQAVELGGETATALGQGVTQAQADAYARGDANWQQARSAYDRPGGTLQALKDIAPATLALGATTLGAGGVVKLATLPFQKPNDPLPPNQTPAPAGTPQAPGTTPGAAPLAGAAGPVPSTLSRIAQESLVPDLPEDTGALTAEEVADLEVSGSTFQVSSSNPLPTVANPDPAQTITGSNVQMGTEMPVPLPTAQAGAGAGAMVAAQPVAASPNELLTPELETLPPPATPQAAPPTQTDAQPVVPELLTPAQLQSYGQAQDIANAQARLDAAMAAQDRGAAELAMMTLTGAKAGSGPLATRAVRAQDEAVTLAILSARPVDAVAMERWAQYPETNEIGPDGNLKRRGIPAKYAKQGDVYVHAEAAQTQGSGFKNLNVSGRTAGFLNTDILNEATDLLRSGITDFANWSRAMVTRFGRAIQEFLAGVWQQITSPQTNAAQNVRMGRAQGTAPVTLGNSGAVLNPAAAPSRAASGTAAATPFQRTQRHRLGFAELGTATEVAQVEISAPEDAPLRQAAMAGVRVWDQFWGPLTKAVRIVKGSVKPRENGLFVPTSGTTNDIQLNRHEKGMDEDVLTVVHELAHHVDSTGLTTAESETPKAGTPMAKLMEQLNTKLPTAKKLNRAVVYWEKNRPKNAFERKIADYVMYLARPDERFARAVEQATRHLSQGRVLAAGKSSPYAAGYLTLAEIETIIPLLHDVLGTGTQTSRTQDRLPGSGATAAPFDAGAVGAAYRGSTGADGGGNQGISRQSASPVGEAPNETQSRFASPNEAARVINGPRTDAMVAEQAQLWLDSVDTQTAVEQFVAQAVPLPLDAAEHAAALLISRLSSESTAASTEVQRLWTHVQSQRMARVWTREFLSADPARALRQRGVVNNTILQPIAPVMAAQGILVDRADAVMDKRFEGGGAGAVEKITNILNNVQGDITERVEAILNAVMGARLKPRVTIREAVAGLVNGKTQRDEMIDDVARALLQKAKSSQVKPEQKTALAALVASLKRTLGAAVRGTALKPDALSFGELLARTFVDQVAEAPLFEESWKAGREQVRLMLIELGMTESAALKRLNELMPATPTVAYAPGMVKQAVQRGFEAAGYGQTLATGADQSGQRAVDVRAEVLRNPQKAMAAVLSVWDAEAQAGGISPEAWAQGRQLAVRALNETLQQWQQQAAETTAKAAEATKNRLLAKDSPALAKLLKELTAKIAPGMTWTEILTDMPSTQKARQKEIYRRLMLDERLRGLTQDERLALTNELDKAWQRERRKVFNRELEKAGVIGEKDKTDRVKVQKALPKLLRMINLGMFNSEMWREAVAPEYGLRMLTAADTAQLRTLAEAAWKLPEGVIRNQKLRDVLNAIQKKTGASRIEVLNSYWTAAVLSGLRTQFDTYMAAINGMGTNLMQIGGLIARGQGRAAIDAHAQWWRGLMEGVRESGQILFKGDTSYLKRFGADLKKALEGETSVTPVPLGENLWQNGNTFQKYGLAPVMMFTGRLMAAADHINNTATTQGAIAVARALHPELYQGRVGFTASERADARTQALREVTGGAEPKPGQERATVSARTREILNGTVRPADYAAASEIGDMAAYQNDPTGVFGIVYSAMKQGLGSIQRGLGDYAQDVTANRFYRVISGLMAGSLHGITGTRFMRFGANFGADLTRYIPGSYVLGKAGFYGRDVSRMQQELLLGKNLVGLMLASTLAAIFLNSDDEDEGWQIEGDWSTLNPQQAKERMAAGYERLTMWKREGGKVRRVSYKQWPTMGLFAVVGGMLDEKRHKPASWAERGTAGHLLRGVATGYVQVKNVSAVRNLVELFGEPSFSADAVTSTLDQMIKTGTNFAGGFMPTLIKDAETWTDPRNFKPEGAAELMLRSMPIARKFVNDGRPQLNLLGEEVKLQRAPYSRLYTSVESGEAHRVLGALLARGLTLPMPSDQVTVIKDNVRVPLETLGRDAVWRYEKAVGQGYKDWLSLEGSDLLKLPVQEADARIKARSAAIKARAKASVVK